MAELFLLLVALGSQGAGRITTAHDNPHRQHDLPLQAAAQAEGAGLAEITGPAVVTTTYRYKPPPKRKGRKLVRSPGRRP